MIGALLAGAILILQIHYGAIKQAEIKGNEWAIAWPYIGLVACLFALHWIRAPWKLDQGHHVTHKQHRERIVELENYKKKVEETDVCLVLVGCRTEVVGQIELIENQRSTAVYRPLENLESVRVIFGNPKKSDMPGKVAERVLAKVEFTNPNSTFEIEGRWTQSGQPATRGFLQPTLDLLRTTFEPGDERHLDIAAKCSDGLFAYNNDSQFGLQRKDRQLIGESVHVKVTLVARHVNNLVFEFKLKNPISGALELIPMQRPAP